MKKILLVLVFSSVIFANNITIVKSCTDVTNTLKGIKKIIQKKGLTLFSVINHKANAKKIGMGMNESRLIIFGNPKLGTTLMKQDMSLGLDLPLKILVYTDKDGSVKMAYRDASWLNKEHNLQAKKKIAKINKALFIFTKKAGQCKKD